MKFFICPQMLKNNSKNRKFYDVECYRLQGRSFHFSLPMTIKKENYFWDKITMENSPSSEESMFSYDPKIFKVDWSNKVFNNISSNFCFITPNKKFHTVFKYLWNRLALFNDREDLVIDRLFFRQNKSFIPTMSEKYIGGIKKKTLVVSQFCLSNNIKDRYMMLNNVQLLYDAFLQEENAVKLLKDYYDYCKKTMTSRSYIYNALDSSFLLKLLTSYKGYEALTIEKSAEYYPFNNSFLIDFCSRQKYEYYLNKLNKLDYKSKKELMFIISDLGKEL